VIILVGGTSESVHVNPFNDNLKELQVIESTKEVPWTRYFKGWATLSYAGKILKQQLTVAPCKEEERIRTEE
jgi:hypothetical protein